MMADVKKGLPILSRDFWPMSETALDIVERLTEFSFACSVIDTYGSAAIDASSLLNIPCVRLNLGHPLVSLSLRFSPMAMALLTLYDVVLEVSSGKVAMSHHIFVDSSIFGPIEKHFLAKFVCLYLSFLV